MIDNETLAKIAGGATGSAIAAWFARATGLSLAVMFFGGLSAAWFVGPAVADASRLPTDYQPAVGFVVGFVAIMFLRKLYDVMESIPAGSIGGTLVEWLRKLLGLPPAAPGANNGKEGEQ